MIRARLLAALAHDLRRAALAAENTGEALAYWARRVDDAATRRRAVQHAEHRGAGSAIIADLHRRSR